jgi:hypothetical protein
MNRLDFSKGGIRDPSKAAVPVDAIPGELPSRAKPIDLAMAEL